MKVSILIPVYNSEQYIAETLECAINQTWQDKEVIVVDDGSTDNSLGIAKEFECDTVKVYSQSNKGASSARNFGFSKSSGGMIQYLDADDLMSPNKIEEQMRIYLAGNEVDNVITCNLLYFNNNTITGLEFPSGSFIKTGYSVPMELLLDILDCPINTQTSIWLTPRHIIKKAGNWNEELTLNDDGEFFFRVIANTKIVSYCPSAVVFYRLPVAGLSSLRDVKASESYIRTMIKARDQIFQYKMNYRAKIAYAKTLSRFYNEFDDGGLFNDFVKKEFKSLGLNFSILENPQRYRLIKSYYSMLVSRFRMLDSRTSGY
jgi:glycosyltransferase involved in cell wall biosynthesis